jgi:hypothetical protein
MQNNANMKAATQRRVPEELHLQLHCFGNLKTRNNNNDDDDDNIAEVSKAAVYALCIKERGC